MLPVIKQRFTPRIAFTLSFELVALNLALLALLMARSAAWSDFPHALEHRWLVLGFVTTVSLLFQFILWSFGLYSRKVIYSGEVAFKRLGGAFALFSVFLFPVCMLFSLSDLAVLNVTVKFYSLLLGLLFAVVWTERFLVFKLFQQGGYLGNLLVLGSGPETAEVLREARRHHGDQLRLVGILGESASEVGRTIEGVPVIGTIRQASQFVVDLDVKTLLLCVRYDHPELPLDFLMSCRFSRFKVLDAFVFYESVGQKILLERLDPVAFLRQEGFEMTHSGRLWKDATERLLALGLLAILAVPCILITAAICLTSRGGPIYTQKRVGKFGRIFTLYKFRSMCQDAEKSTGAVFWTPGDQRVTRIGKWLRRLRLDEIPQLLNVLKGDMAFVGPRPERPEFVQNLEKTMPFYGYRHLVKPGLTGWAQVCYGYTASDDDTKEKLRYDLYYVKHVHFLLDVLIVLATLRAVVVGSGVRQTSEKSSKEKQLQLPEKPPEAFHDELLPEAPRSSGPGIEVGEPVLTAAAQAAPAGLVTESIRVRELAPGEEARWDQFVEAQEDGSPFHLTAWRDTVKSVFSFEYHYLVCEKAGAFKAVLPLFLVPGGLLNRKQIVSVPFGVYGGLCGADEEARAELLRHADKIRANVGASLMELRHFRRPVGNLPAKSLYVTYIKELPSSSDKYLEMIPRKARAAARKGLTSFGLRAGPLERAPASMEAFFELFAANKRKLGSPTMPEIFFQQLLRHFGEKAFLFGVWHESRIVGAVISLIHGDTVIPYYAGVDPESEYMQVSNVMYVELMRYAVERGLKRFDFSRSRRDSGAARFKEHQGFEPAQLHYEYTLAPGARIPNVSPSNSKYDLFRTVWMQLPFGVTKWLGPKLVKNLP
jgi:FemAB-related protein (PEP-CTERM system-associated)